MNKNIMNSKELADYLGISINTLYRKRKQGLPYFKVNKKYMYNLKDVMKWFKEYQNGRIRQTTKLDLDIEYIKYLYLKENMSTREIARILNVSKTTICDRLRKEKLTRPAINYNKKHGMKNTRLYRIWHGIKSRCLNPNDPTFKYYGARGIKICTEWLEFETFMKWAKVNGYNDNLQIDRIDNNGDYEPNNCRFVTPKENYNNRRSNNLITINGQTKTLTQWADKSGLKAETIAWRIKKGWPEDQWLKPARPKK